MSRERIRESVIAGSWYPGNPEALTKTIREFLNGAPETSLKGDIVGMIAPHAGYMYSGPVAAHAYKLLEKKRFETVVVVAPSHRARFDGVSVYDQGGYRTPLGVVPLDEELIAELKSKNRRIQYVPEAHMQEHSLEIQLPFLQVALPDFKLVPLVMGDQRYETCQWLAEALAESIGNRSVLLVGSSDLSHFHSYREAKQLDQVVIDKVDAFDPQGLDKSLTTRKCEACGGGPMVSVMLASRLLGADESKVLHYANSGDVTGDHGTVVGYMAAVLTRESGEKNKKFGETKNKEEATSKETGVDLGLEEEEKSYLHKIAMETIEARCRGEKPGDYKAITPTLEEARGAFVTLRKNGRLRGCIGHIFAQYPLVTTISQMAPAAAFEDPRFPPLRLEELHQVDIEISVLTPLRAVKDVNEIEVGKHGIYIKKGPYAGLLLPQVATEQNWDRMTFLEHTCMKAGLPVDAWKDKDTEIKIFSADIF